MKLGLQLGYGMLDLSKNLTRMWPGTLTVLSPRDLTEKQMVSLSVALLKLGGEIAIDPQFYIPKTDHKKLKSHAHWPATYDTLAFWTSKQVKELILKSYQMSSTMGCSRFILPALMPTKVDAMWLSYQKQVADAGRALVSGEKLILSLPLTADSLKDDFQIQDILDFMSKIDVDGVYILCEHPGGSYIVEDETWLKNLLELIAGLKLRKLETIVGYCNAQSLIYACAGADYILSGNWMNVRSFDHKKFLESDSEVRNRTPWFYFPNMLSEFKRSALDTAKSLSYLSSMRYPAVFNNPNGDKIFNPSIQPSQVFDFPDSFMHFLSCIKLQASDAKKSTFVDTIAYHEAQLDNAEKELVAAESAGVRADNRSLLPAIDAMKSGLNVLKTRRGGQLRRNW